MANIFYGKRLRKTTVLLNHYIDKCTQLSRNLETLINRDGEPARHRIRHCQVCQFGKLCLAHFQEKDDLSLLGGMGVNQVQKLNSKGIFTVNQLSYTYKPKRRKKKVLKPNCLVHSLKALALREQKTFVLDIPAFPNRTWDVFLDIEGLPDENFWYLIGVLGINRKTHKKIEHFFWADTWYDTRNILRGFSDLVSKLNDFTIFHYGNYEINALTKLNALSNGEFDELLNAVLQNRVNILSCFVSDLYPPTYTNGLKDIARHIGFCWSEESASGIQSIVWRKKWELTGDIRTREKLIEYNRNDCEALCAVKNWIEDIGAKDILAKDNHFATTDNLTNRVIRNKWGDPNFQCADFEAIDKVAYFDYQRNKIYLRTNKKVRSAVRKNSKRHSVKDNQVDKAISYLPTKCSICGHSKFYKLGRQRQIHIDLHFMKNGIKRWNTILPGSSFRCAECGEEFTPHRYGRNLLIWTMNQYIKYTGSIPKINDMLMEQFNIFVPENDLYNYKSALAEEYRETYDKIRQELINGPLIHMDETKTELVGQPNGYVWVMASMDTVYYFFRPNREAKFLKEFLSGFQGVLVSDFYSGYDSLACLQQKCLIHLIRDLNNDFLANQLDTELKALMIRFGKLLRKIIATIDEHGLKRRYLQKHTQEVESFFAEVLSKDYNTQLAQKWQKRFKKNTEKLFRFLNFDGIPWNNNNGENAIKAFAKYRERATGSIRESGLEHYLILLSIEQTCKYRGISFLEFLKSKKSYF